MIDLTGIDINQIDLNDLQIRNTLTSKMRTEKLLAMDILTELKTISQAKQKPQASQPTPPSALQKTSSNANYELTNKADRGDSGLFTI
ncbi:MAG: hypothetical protein PV340_05185 [Wolbachia sp.]|nr:hypothetical protein [Wolbachia sp.]